MKVKREKVIQLCYMRKSLQRYKKEEKRKRREKRKKGEKKVVEG